MRLHIEPFDPDRIYENQPWLSPDENFAAEQFGEQCEAHIQGLMESIGRGDCIAPPFKRFILTEDFRIVEEPSFMRWGIFMERGNHRQIDLTTISAGEERSKEEPPNPRPYACWVSTVFIGGSERELFETIIFGGPLDCVKWRSDKLIDAKKCHWEAVTLAHQLRRYMKQRGRRYRKDWLRMQRYWRLVSVRGHAWAYKHLERTSTVADRLTRVPGCPPLPLLNPILELAQQWLPRTSLATSVSKDREDQD